MSEKLFEAAFELPAEMAKIVRELEESGDLDGFVAVTYTGKNVTLSFELGTDAMLVKLKLS